MICGICWVTKRQENVIAIVSNLSSTSASVLLTPRCSTSHASINCLAFTNASSEPSNSCSWLSSSSALFFRVSYSVKSALSLLLFNTCAFRIPCDRVRCHDNLLLPYHHLSGSCLFLAR